MRKYSRENADAAQTIANILKSLRDRWLDKTRLSPLEFAKCVRLGFQFLEVADAETKAFYWDEFHQAYTRKNSRRLLASVFKMIKSGMDSQAGEWAIQLEDDMAKRADLRAVTGRDDFFELWDFLPDGVQNLERARYVLKHSTTKRELSSITKRARRWRAAGRPLKWHSESTAKGLKTKK